MRRFLLTLLLLCCTAFPALAQTAITLPIAANAVADLGNGPIKVRMVAGNASIFTAQGSGIGSTSGPSTTLTLTATPATAPLVGGLISGNGITSGTTIIAYNGTTGITLSAAMTVPSSTTVSWGAACPLSAPSNVIQASPQAGYYIMYTQARVCAVSPGGPVNTLLISPVFNDIGGSGPVNGPSSSVVGDIAEWANGAGTLLKDVAPAAMVDQICATNNDFLIRLSGTWQCGSLGAGLSLTGSVLSTAPGVDANIQNQQSGNYTVAMTDCGATIYFSVASQATLTLPAVTGFPSNCSVLVKSRESNPNGVILSGFPAAFGPILYPGQSLGVKITGSSPAWRSFYNPQPWAPVSAVTLFASSTGNDANDGLTVGTPITLATACSRRQTIFQPGAVTIQLADGTYSTPDSNGALCTVYGNSGGNSNTLTNIVGNCVTLGNVLLSIPDGDTGIFIKDIGEVEGLCIALQGAGSGVSIGVSGAQFSVFDAQQTLWRNFGAGSILADFGQSASFNLIGAAAMTLNAAPGGSGTVIALASSANMSSGAATIAIPSALAWGGQFLELYGPTMATLGGLTFTGAGVGGTTGKRATLIGGGAFLVTGGVSCNTFFPGSGSCSIIDGAQDDAGDNPTSPTPVGGTNCVLTAVSHLTVVNGVVTLCN
jgi:hypothetical protein